MASESPMSMSKQDGFFIKRLSSHTYVVNLHHNLHSEAAAPSTGYLASSFLEVSRYHFSTTLSRYRQPHTVAVQLNFLRPVQGDLAIFKIKDVKLGSQTSMVQVALIEYHSDLYNPLTTLDPSRIGDEIATGFMTYADIAKLTGSTPNSPFDLQPAPSPVNLDRLRRDADETWKFYGSMACKGTDDCIDFFFEKYASPEPQQVLDQWVRFSDGELFSSTSIGMVADLCVPKLDLHGRTASQAVGTDDGDSHSTAPSYHTSTLVLNIDIKKALPARGVDFLFVRVQYKRASNGRSDAEVTILDPDGELVATCSQIMLDQSTEATPEPNRRGILGKL